MTRVHVGLLCETCTFLIENIYVQFDGMVIPTNSGDSLVSFDVSVAVTFRCISVRGHNVFAVELWFDTLIHIEY